MRRHRARLSAALAGACLAAALLAGPAVAANPAQGNFGLHGFDLALTNADGSSATQAGSHPFAVTTSLLLNTDSEGDPEGQLRDLEIAIPPGLIGDTTAYPRCNGADFLELEPKKGLNNCPLDTTVGIAATGVSAPDEWFSAPVFNLVPPPGVLLRLGFRALVLNVIVDVRLSTEPPYRPIATVANTPQLAPIFANKTQLWGDPSDPAHDELRGPCGSRAASGLPPDDLEAFEFKGSGDKCPVPHNPKPLLTAPTDCDTTLGAAYEARSWDGEQDSGSVLLHDPVGNPAPFTGCGRLGFAPEIKAAPTAKAATSPTGLDFTLQLEDEGLTSTTGLAASQIEKTVVTLPAGMSVNPAQAEGLEVCSRSRLAAETLQAAPGEGCPQAAKIGTIEVESPLISATLRGSLYVAEPYANSAGDALIAFYIVIRDRQLGINVIQPVRVEPDPATGRLTAIAEQMPQLPFSAFRLRFREGARSPLVTPPTCGTHRASALLYPYSGAPPVSSSSAFEIISGPNNTPCPSGAPPFAPRLAAGTLSNAAGRFSPFVLSLTRTDAEQEITNLSIKLPPGVLARLAGLGACPDSAIALAASRTGPHGGAEELAAPACPAGSQVGNTLAGAGVGPGPAYAPGKVYLAGPYHGAPLSLVAITAGVVGPFDIGTVVVRFAIDVNPETGEVFLDSTASDPIPHIIKGIVLHLRDIRSAVDRPQFTLNPTSCEPTSTAATVLGSGLDFISPADDNPFVSTSPFQAADCAALPFKPKLRFRTVGSTKRGGNPSLRAHVAMNGIGEAAIRYAQVTLPKSEFLDNAHIGTVCTRVQFRAGAVPGEQCPAASIYGAVKAFTPILDGALAGPIFLRSSEHKLPDLVASLNHGQINVALVGRVDSVKGGGIRNTFEFVPDAPVTSAAFTFFGKNKGLLENSRNLCKTTNKVKVLLKAHSGKRLSYKTLLKPKGCKKKRSANPHRGAKR